MKKIYLFDLLIPVLNFQISQRSRQKFAAAGNDINKIFHADKSNDSSQGCIGSIISAGNFVIP
ncbi:MAG: hypothetical protein WCE54_16875 [Ignavibacteriaceae bacterium]